MLAETGILNKSHMNNFFYSQMMELIQSWMNWHTLFYVGQPIKMIQYPQRS